MTRGKDTSPTARRCDRVRLSASTSFNEEQIAGLDELVRLILRGADMRVFARKPIVAVLAKRVSVMKATIARQREERDRAELGAPDPHRGSAGERGAAEP